MNTLTNAHDLLKQEHREVEELYDEFLNASLEDRQELADRILTNLTVHTALEEEFYYPELEQAGENVLAEEFRTEHQAVKLEIGKLKLMNVENEKYEPTMKALMETVKHHVTEEEQDAMPRVERILGRDRLETILPAMEERKEELERSTFKQFIASVR